MTTKRATARKAYRWEAGLSRVDISPPVGTHLFGFAARDRARGYTRIHDPLELRALWISAGGEPVLILAYDVLFFDRGEADRIKGAVGRELDLSPRQILINGSHTHLGPVTGTWAFAEYEPLKNRMYLDRLAERSATTAREARNAAVPAALRYGATRTTVPLSRRYLNPQGQAEWRPAPDAPVYDVLHMLAFETRKQQPAALVVSASCHPSTVNAFEVSADYPGILRHRLDRSLGQPVSLFLQGVGGDTKPRATGDGEPDDTGRATWRPGTWDDIRRTGNDLADAVIRYFPLLRPEPAAMIRTVLVEVELPLAGIPSITDLRNDSKPDGTTDPLRRLWADAQESRLKAQGRLRATAPVQVHWIRLSPSLGLLALEGEPVGAWGTAIERAFRPHTVIPLGYSNGQGLYLPVEANLDEGGYEVESVYEYGFPAEQLAPGFSKPLFRTFKTLKATST